LGDLLLAIDVGNSSTTFGLFSFKSPRDPQKTFSIPTRQLNNPSFPSYLKKISPRIEAAVVSSVVPRVDRPLRRAISKKLSIPVHFITTKTLPRIKNLTQHPAEVGADRLVNARAAIEIHRGPSIVVDFGTATTFDCVQRGGAYLGGVIAPGPVISAEALFLRTAKLPNVILKKPAKILGRNTVQSIESGLYHGYRGLVMEIVKQLKSKLGAGTKVIATGGQARWILKGLSCIDRYEPTLTLNGLFYSWIDFKTIR
jgi:type III pantothenate kinase